jgi:hypothetical protein
MQAQGLSFLPPKKVTHLGDLRAVRGLQLAQRRTHARHLSAQR